MSNTMRVYLGKGEGRAEAYFQLFQAGESAKQRKARWANEMTTYEGLGLDWARITDRVPDRENGGMKTVTCVAKRSLADMKAMLLAEAQPSYGKGPDGNKCHNGGYSPLMSGTLGVEGHEDLEGTNVWHVKLPKGKRFEKLGWWVDHVRELYLGQKSLTMAAIGDGQLTMRFDRGNAGWLKCFDQWGLVIQPTPKVVKRLKVATRSMPFRGVFAGKEVTIAFVEHTDEDKCLFDGLVLIDAKLWHSIIDADPQGVDYGPLGDGIKKLEEEDAEGLAEKLRKVEEGNLLNVVEAESAKTRKLLAFIDTSRTRLLDDRKHRARKTKLGNFRCQMPAGVCDQYPNGGQVKGNYLVVPNLTYKGERVHILTSRENVKKEVSGGAHWLLGIEPQYAKAEARTSTQLIINLEELFPAEQVEEWMKQDMLCILESIIGGRLEERLRMEAEANEAAFGEADEEITSVLYRFRQYAEDLLGTGHDFRHAPSLAVDTYEALLKRMCLREKAKLNVPVPHGMKMQVLPVSIVKLAGYESPVKSGEIDLCLQRGYAVVTDEDWREGIRNWGGADEDDSMVHFLVHDLSQGGALRVVTIRHPNGRGEYMIFKPLEGGMEFKAETRLHLAAKKTAAGTPDWTRPTFTRHPLEVRCVDLGKLPRQVSKRMRSGDLRIEPVPGMEKGKSYPQGYQIADVVSDLHHAVSGASPGYPINALMLLSLVGVEPETMPCTMESIVDTFVQGGSKEAMDAITAAADGWVATALTHCYANKKKIDRDFWRGKNFQTKQLCLSPEVEEWIAAGQHLDENGPITSLMRTLLGNQGDYDGFNDSPVTGGSIYHRGMRVLVEWLKAWQEEMPCLRRFKMTEEGKTKLARSYKDWQDTAGAAWGGIGRKTDKAWRQYEEGVRQYIERCTVHGLIERGSYLRTRETLPNSNVPDPRFGLMMDHMMWNRGVAELVIEHLKRPENRPLTVDQFTYRLCNYSVENCAQWLDDLKLSNEAGLDKLLDVLEDFIGGGDKLLKLLDKAAVGGWIDPEKAPMRKAILLTLRDKAKQVTDLFCQK